MPRRRQQAVKCGILAAIVLVAHPLSAAAQEKACKPQKIIRYLDVELAVDPPSGSADRQVRLSADCLPADRPVIVWRGQAFDDVQPVSNGSVDALGSFNAEATVPADARPGENYYFAIMIDDHVVGTGSFLVDGGEESTVQ